MDDWAPLLDQPEDNSPITEEFDPSWPYTFKWGVSAEGRTDVWRTNGGLDGMPTHRGELAQVWGRPPQFRDGDQLGMAQYIPAERKLDGTLVAPPVILLHAYYGLPTPRSVYDWFEQQFPNVVVREAVVTSDLKGRPTKLASDWAPETNPDLIVRWIWSKQDGLLVWESDSEGLPTHDQKAMASWGRHTSPGDFLGYADIHPDKIEIDPIKYETPSVAIAAVKAELSKIYPDKHIVSGDDLAEQYGVEFRGNPDKVARRAAAARWMQVQAGDASEMPLEGSESDAEATVQDSDVPVSTLAGLKRLFTVSGLFTTAVNKAQTVKMAGADMDGAMVGLFIPEEVGKKIKVKDGEPLENLHITLLYFQDKAADRDDWDEVKRIVEQIAKQTPALSGKIGGYGVFNNDEDVLWATPTVQGLVALRQKLFEACEDAGFPVSKTHDWVPHITLKYDHKGKLPRVEDEIKLEFPDLAFAQGNKQESFKFEGHFEKEATDDWAPTTGEWGGQSWSGWQGAHRFVTDGKEVLTDPESQTGGHGMGHPGLIDKFREFYPDSDKIVGGWAVPTADEMGYGVYPYQDTVPLQDVMSVLDKHLDKPTHFVDWDDLFDASRYKAFPLGGQRNLVLP